MRDTTLRERHAPGTNSPSGATPPTNANRRRFLLGLGAGGAAAVAATAPALMANAPVDAAAATVAGKGYQDTEHVRDYYATTRI